MRNRVLGAARDFSPRADSLAVFIQPPRTTARMNIRAHVKHPRHWQPYHCLDTRGEEREKKSDRQYHF